jgi:hypothetical protein
MGMGAAADDFVTVTMDLWIGKKQAG